MSEHDQQSADKPNVEPYFAPGELLPCPHCGGEADVSEGTRGDGSPWWYIECIKCASSTEPEVWNQRYVQSESKEFKGWAIQHADRKRWRTMDTIGMPDWTDDKAKALVCRLREHIERYAEDDEDDIRIVEVGW